MTIGPWPLESTGLTPADVPADYNVYPDIWNDGRGYKPVVVGRIANPTGTVTILISLSPGNTISATLPIGAEHEVSALLGVVEALAAAGRGPLPASPPVPPGGSLAPFIGP